MKYKRNVRDLRANIDKPVRLIGLTGGIGSGKSVAERMLENNGFTVIDADAISRAAFAAGTDGEKTLCAVFPQAAKNGALDRKLLRDIAANDAALMQKLNDVTHPAIIAEIERRIALAPRPAVLSAPLLFETPLAAKCDVTVCIYCPRSTRIERLVARDGITAAQAERIIAAQIPDTERCTLADYVIPSNRDINEFEEEIAELFGEIVRQK